MTNEDRTILLGISKKVRLINRIIIYLWDKLNGGHLEHVL